MIPTMPEAPGGRMHATTAQTTEGAHGLHRCTCAAGKENKIKAGVPRIAISHARTQAACRRAIALPACAPSRERRRGGGSEETGQRRSEKLATGATSRGPALALRVPLLPPPPLHSASAHTTTRCSLPERTPSLPSSLRAPPRPDRPLNFSRAAAVALGSCRVVSCRVDRRRRRPESRRSSRRQVAVMEGKSVVMSALGIGIGVGVGLGLASAPWAGGASASARAAGITVERVEQDLRRLLVDASDSKVTFDEFPYYLRYGLVSFPSPSFCTSTYVQRVPPMDSAAFFTNQRKQQRPHARQFRQSSFHETRLCLCTTAPPAAASSPCLLRICLLMHFLCLFFFTL